MIAQPRCRRCVGGGGESGAELALHLVAEELGIGLAVGLGVALVAGTLFRWCMRRGWLTEVWNQISIVALAIGSFAAAQSLGGSGYIAAFSGGLLFGALSGAAGSH